MTNLAEDAIDLLMDKIEFDNVKRIRNLEIGDETSYEMRQDTVGGDGDGRRGRSKGAAEKSGMSDDPQIPPQKREFMRQLILNRIENSAFSNRDAYLEEFKQIEEKMDFTNRTAYV